MEFTSGKFDADDGGGDAQLISATGGSGIVISGDAHWQAAGQLKASSVTITSNSDQKIAELRGRFDSGIVLVRVLLRVISR